MTRSLKIALVVAASCCLTLAAHAATDQENLVLTATVGNILDIQMIDDSGITAPAPSGKHARRNG